jgi:hypothetical protein
MEYCHMFGMAMSFSLTSLALIIIMDEKIIGLSDKNRKCALLDTCRECYKYSETDCRVKKIFQFALVMLIIISIMPLLAEKPAVTYNSNILGTFYTFSHAEIYQVIEIRYFPMLAVFFFLLSLLFLKLKNGNMFNYSKIFFSTGFGFIGFAFFRMIFLHVYQNNMTWFICWEEITELMFMTGSAYIIRLYRNKIFRI